MKSMLREVNDHGTVYEVLMFVCPGCKSEEGDGSGLHMLPVNTSSKQPSWGWNGSFDKPTLTPSIMTGRGTDKICHSFLTEGIFKFLGDCTHSLVNQEISIPDLPQWVIND